MSAQFILAQYAVKLSSQDPGNYFHLARTEAKANLLNISDYVPHFTKGCLYWFTNLEQLIRFVGNSVIQISLVGFFVILTGILILLFRYAHIFAHVLQHLLIIKLNPTFGRVFALAILCAPFLFNFGIGLVIVFWCIVFFLIVRPIEKTFLVISSLFLLGVPLLMPFMAGTLTARSESVYNIILAMRNHASEQIVHKLKANFEQSDNDGSAAFSLGYLAKKRGKYHEAKDFFKKSLEKKFLTSASENNLANVLFALGDVKGAIQLYRRPPQSFYKWYNLYQAYYEINDVQRGTDALAKARAFSNRQYKYYDTIKPSGRLTEIAHYNRLLVDEPVPNKYFIEKLLGKTPLKEDVRNAYWKTFFSPIPIGGYFLFLFGVFFVFIVLFVLNKMLQFPEVCSKCAQPACQWCYPTIKHTDLCSQCFSVYIRRESVDPAAREAKDVEVAEQARRSAMLVRFLSFICPGSGHMYLGYMIRGCIFLMLWGFLIVSLYFTDNPFVSTFAPSSFGAIFKTISFSILLLVFYIMVLRSIFQER